MKKYKDTCQNIFSSPTSLNEKIHELEWFFEDAVGIPCKAVLYLGKKRKDAGDENIIEYFIKMIIIHFNHQEVIILDDLNLEFDMFDDTYQNETFGDSEISGWYVITE